MPTSQTSSTESSTTSGEGFHLSYQQRRLWLHSQSEEGAGSSAHRLCSQCMLRIEDALDTARLRDALQRVVNRHDILRTTFHIPAGLTLAVQVVSPHGRPDWREVDLRDCEQQSEQLETRSAQDLREPFHLNEGPLLRASLVALAADNHALILTLSALVADAATLRNLTREVHSAYGGDRSEEESEDPIQYVQLIEWQQSLEDGEDAATGREHWRSLAPLPPVTIPLQRTPREPAAFAPASLAIPIASQTAASLLRTERPDAFLLGCWLTLLWRISGQSPLRIGLTCQGRGFEELQAAMGPVARVVPITCALQQGQSFRDLVALLPDKLDEAADWQDSYQRSPSEGLCEAACFEWNEWPEETESQRPHFSLISQQSISDSFHVRLSITRAGESLFVSLDYDPQFHAPAYIDRIASQLNTLLNATIGRPDTPVDQLPLLGEDERRFLVDECNRTRATYPHDVCLHQLIAAQAALTPHRIAVTCGNASLTYAELDKRANQLAHRLRELGIGAEIRAGIFMHRSLEMMIGLLAILKAGGSYVPLDPVYPPERLAFMLADAQVKVLLTESLLHQRLAVSNDLQILCLDEPFEKIAGNQPGHAPHPGVSANNLAYTLYTSGSTGKPKGALITHRGLVNYLSWSVKAYDVESGAGTAVHSSIGFDATITALFPPLLIGRAVTLAREADGIDGLREAMQQSEPFSLIKITPAHLSLLNEAIADSDLAAKTRMLVIGGDALSGMRLEQWHKQAPLTRFINEYGPTETIVGCCVHEATSADLTTDAVPIGRPIANTQLYVLDPHLAPQPIGIAGDLYIGGEGVSRGYLNRPSLTAERFLPDHLSHTPGTRLYRTGDLVIQHPDGVLSFLGRLDHQVKIRSYRIELGEIEAQLEQHPGVARSVVIARNEASGEKSLAAYIQPSATKLPSSEELRTWLLTRLPEHMVPAVFLTLDALPLTAHGKIDRNALPDPKTVRAASAEPFVAAQTPTEQTLAEIWSKVLRLERIGIHDDFFRSGGDSILSILVVARAAKAGLRFTTRDLFQQPTIAELASMAATIAPAAAPCAVEGAVPLTPIQHWLFERQLPNPHHFNQAVMLDVLPSMSLDLLRRAFDHLVAHHDALRLRFAADEASEVALWRQFHSNAEGTVEASEVDLAALAPAEQQSTLTAHAEEVQTGLNISHGPVLRAVLFHFGDGAPSQLLIVVHHLVVDGVSWRILLDDLATACQQLARNEPIPLPAKTTSFKDWSIRLRDYAAGEALAAESSYWLRRPATHTPLPIDMPSTPDANTIASTARVRIALDRAQASALLHEVSAAYRTQIDDVLLTALTQACARWTGSSSLLIDLEGHGRPGAESGEEFFTGIDVSRTAGWFTSIYPVRLALEGNGPGEELKAIKEQLRSVPNRGLGYGVLRYLSPNPALRAQLAALPQPQISFNYLGSIDSLAAEPILDVASHPPGSEEDPAARRAYLLEIIAQIKGGCLELEIVYSTALHHRATIENLANNIHSNLESLLAHCLTPGAGGFTPSDFPETGLSQEELDRLVADLG